MADIQGSPRKTKQSVLEFLRSRGGVMRTGQHRVHQWLAWRRFGTTQHEEITALRKCLIEMANEGLVVMRRGDTGLNYIALKEAFDPTDTADILPEDELPAEFLLAILPEYYRMDDRLAKAQDDAEHAMELAQQFEQAANEASRRENDAKGELQRTREELEEIKKSPGFAVARTAMDELEAAMDAKARAEDVLARKLAEIGDMPSMLADAKAEIQRLKDEAEETKRENDEVIAKMKAEHAEALRRSRQETSDVQQVAEDLRKEMFQFERGDGLTAATAAAAFMTTTESIMSAFIDKVKGAMGESLAEVKAAGLKNCQARINDPARKEVFADRYGAAYDKIGRRKKNHR